MAAPRTRTLTLTAILAALFVGAFDQTVVAIALPRIAEDLGATDRYAAIATAYLLAATVLVPIYGKLADGGSKHRLLAAAAALFGVGAVGSASAGLAGPVPGIGGAAEQLIVARALQGAGGAGLFALATILLAELVPPRARGRYHGLLGATIGLATLLAPWVGGWLTDHAGAAFAGLAGWRWTFLASLPGAAAVAAAALIGGRTRHPTARRAAAPVDGGSAAALVGALAAGVVALQLDRTAHPWNAPTTLALFAVSAGLATAFALRARRASEPVLRLDTLAQPVLAATLPAAAALGAVFLTVLHFVPLYLIQLRGASATAAGLGLIPLSAAAVLAALASGRVASHSGRVKPLMAASMALLAVGALLLAATIDGRVPLQLALVVLGIAIGVGLPLYTLAAQNALPDHRTGEATSASHLARQLGGTVAVAAMGTLLASSFGAAVGGDDAASGRVPYAIGTAWSTALVASALADAEPAFAAIEAGDVAALLTALEDGALPAEAHVAAVGAAFGAPAQRAATTEGLRRQATAAASTAVAALRADVERGFRSGLRAVFGAAAWIAAAGLLAVAFVPDLRLRGRDDPRSAGRARSAPRYAPTR